jgi:hypothetical protein
MKNFTFNTPEELQEKLFAMVAEAEKRARARTLPLEKLGVVVEAVASTPYGIAVGDGGHVAKSYSFRDPETTYFRLAWDTRGKQKFISVSVFRGNAKKVAYGANGYLDISATGKWEAFRLVFPFRAKRIEDWLRNKRIAAAIRHLPPPPVEIRAEIQEVQPDEGGLVKAEGPHKYYIGTPAGWLYIPYQKGDERRTAWTILARQGFPVPRRKANRVWTEALTAALALHVLGEV